MSEWTPAGVSGNFSLFETSLPGVRVVQARAFDDDRGSFCETYSARDFAAIGITDDFVQDNQSVSALAGTVRGLHYQLPPMAQPKLVRVLHGAIVDVAVDIRRPSPTFARHIAIALHAGDGRQVYVPAGFAHGFVTTAPNTVVAYKVGQYYSRADERGIRFDDPELAIAWGVPADSAVLSARDRAHPPFSAAELWPK